MPFTFQKDIQPFLDYLRFQKRYSRHTIISYTNDLAGFIDYLAQEYGTLALAEIKPVFIRSWLAKLKNEGMEGKSINRKISTLKSFFRYQLKQQAIIISPMATIVSPKVKKRLPQFVDSGGMEKLFSEVKFTDNWQGKTDRLLLQLLYSTGMRRAELVNLKESQIDYGNYAIKVLGKGNKERIIPAGKELLTYINEYTKAKANELENYDSTYLLVNSNGKKITDAYVYNTVKKYLNTVTTIDKKSPHILRHTFATHLMNNGAELNAVKELLGHSSLAATQIYTHNSIEKLKDIHKKAHPKA
jgi:integrase/recombinase XerC